MSEKSPSFGRCVLAGGGAAALAAAVAVAVSSPALTRPLPHGLLFVLALPLVLGGLLTALLALASRRIAAPLGALLAAAPWLLVAGAPVARLPWMAGVGAVVAVLAALFLAARRPVGVVHALVVGALLIVARGPGVITLSDQTVKPVVFYGVDSGNWEMIDPMIAGGELPNFKHLKEQGAHGLLLSEEAAISPRVWTIFVTGVEAAESGITAFESTRQDLKAGRVWDLVSKKGGDVGLMGYHVTWPPDPLPGFCVPSWLSHGIEAHPAEASFLKILELAGREGHSYFSLGVMKAGLSAMSVSAADHALTNLLTFAEIVVKRLGKEDAYWRGKMIQARFTVDLYLEYMRRAPAPFSTVIFYCTDTLGHRYWKYHEPEAFPELVITPEKIAARGGVVKESEFEMTPEEIAARGGVIKESYREADRLLGRLLESFDWNQAHLVVTSDHGMGPTSEGGRQVPRIKPSALAAALGISDPKLVRYSAVGKRLILESTLPGAEGTAFIQRIHDQIKSAYVEESPGEAPFVIEELREDENSLVIHFYLGVFQDFDNHLRVGDNRVQVKDLFNDMFVTGDHTRNGIVALYGPCVQQGAAIQAADLFDVAPTLLHLMGEAVPENMPGRVLAEALVTDCPGPQRRTAEKLPPPPPSTLPTIDKKYDAGTTTLSELGYAEGEEEEPPPAVKNPGSR